MHANNGKLRVGLMVVCWVLYGVTGRAVQGALPHFVDLSPVVNTAPEDDGIADNNKGGWTDEGINDMFLYPPLPTGDVRQNAHHLRWLDPAEHNGYAALMLRGEQRGQDKPVTAHVAVPDITGTYIYFAHHSVGGSDAAAGYQAATYTVHYADGSAKEIAIQQGQHLLHWWCGNWWENRGRDAWPVHMGRNVYTMKWGQHIGIWATQWQNPHPDRPIAGLTFESAGKATPVLWAVTIDDADYQADDDAKKQTAWGRPDTPPENYFEPKLMLERAAIYKEALADGFIEGVRSVEVIRDDWVAVTVDPALTQVASGPCFSGDHAAATYQIPETFTVRSATDPNYETEMRPLAVGRDSYEYWNGDIGPFPMCTIYWHTFYLRLPEPLQSGHTYSISVAGIASDLRTEKTLAYDDATTETAVIKVNQVAYVPGTSRRYAYLGWWAGDQGAIDYRALDTFRVIDEATGEATLTAPLVLRETEHNPAGEQVWEMDIAPLTPGRYHIHVPGLGRSSSFDVGGDGLHQLFFHTQRAFYHQRCGFPLEEPYTRFEKEACHLWVYESGYMVDDPNYTPQPGEEKRKYVGGYHDAGDFDCFTYHLRATAQTLDAFERAPDIFQDGSLNLPESGSGIPDILDEARWALFFYLDHQAPDGGIPKGRCNDQDSRRQSHVEWGPFGIFQPDPISNAEYAAVAAHFAHVYRAYDEAVADRYLESAIRAFDWTWERRADEEHQSFTGFLVWAAGTLFRATGEARFNEALLETMPAEGLRLHWADGVLSPLMQWPYILSTHPETCPEVQQQMRTAIIESADRQLAGPLENELYRWGGNPQRALGWGNGNGGGHYADVLIRAWWLTGESKYFDGAALNADFQLGCNPLSKTFITGMGARPPRHPQISAFLYEEPGKRGGTVEGITIYGIASREPDTWYPAERPVLRRWRDLGNGTAEISSEFTVTETLGFSAMLYAAFYGKPHTTLVEAIP